ncbi:hypothetical protein WR25_21843 [Diploscapter pachys]|uniref:DDT domain-containing protein n=1 Tax=Diploscapter pachys TaxID=2018661 RepID=A0A2A2LQP6_9BILA|nr:hypothetical protein WR25_21843 [Diploscapter pachys]
MPRVRTKRKFYDEYVDETPRKQAKKAPTQPKSKKKSAPTPKNSSTGKKKVSYKTYDGKDYNGDEYDSDAELDDLYESDASSLTSLHQEEEVEVEDEEELVFDETTVVQPDTNADLVCPWIDLDPEAIPELELPPSSQDIPLPAEHILDVVELYEILRSYYQTLKLTPFIFEDFCAALTSPENSRILAEVHICLFKALLKNDDEEQVHYSVMDTNCAYNIIVNSIESMTYAEVLRMYIEADQSIDSQVLAAVGTPNYPFVDLEQRLVVLLWLAYRFLETNEYKRLVERNGRPAKDEACRICTKSGGMSSCDMCEVCVHPTCSKLVQKPDENLIICDLCQVNMTPGAMDPRHLPPGQEISHQPLRMEPIGRDRHGRIYWFVVRRIFVQEDEEEPSSVHYYSTAPQFYELICRMDPAYYEYDLCIFFLSKISSIMEQMAVTFELTADRKEHMKQLYLSQAPSQRSIAPPREAYLLRDCAQTMANILVKLRARADKESPSAMSMLEENVLYMLGFQDGQLVNTFWSSTLNESALLSLAEMGQNPLVGKGMFRIGSSIEDHSYMAYRNHFTTHELGEHPNVKKKALDKRKYMSTRFSIMEEGDGVFEWSTAKNRDLYGNSRLQAKSIQWTIGRLLRKIPLELMHRNWAPQDEAFKTELNSVESVESLRDMLLRVDCGMRRTLFVNQWWNSVGLIRLTRTNQEQRELQTKEFLRKKKEENEMAKGDYDDENLIWIKYTKAPLRKTLWRIKDEMYRLNGKGGLGGWLFVSNNFIKHFGPQPEFPNLELENEKEEKTKGQQVAFEKRSNINSLVEKLHKMRKEQLKEESKKSEEDVKMEAETIENGVGDYANSKKSDAVADISESQVVEGNLVENEQKVESSQVKQEENHNEFQIDTDIPTSFPFKLKHLVRHEQPGSIVGIDLPWPLLQPFRFVSNGTKRTSIWVIPKLSLRKLCRTGGNQLVYIPGFSTSAKSNFTAWNYPSFRPTFEHCWRWRTLHSNSLHAIALQLKILWYSIRWTDMHPEDDDPDRRVVHHLIDRDERRETVAHREFPPYGTYERYKLRIEVFPLEDDQDTDETDGYKKTTKRRRSARGPKLREVKEEWFDGIELKLHEIRDYWARKLYAPVHEEIEAPPAIEYYETAQTTQSQQIEPKYQIHTRMVPSSSNFHGYQVQHQVSPTSSMPQLQAQASPIIYASRQTMQLTRRLPQSYNLGINSPQISGYQYQSQAASQSSASHQYYPQAHSRVTPSSFQQKPAAAAPRAITTYKQIQQQKQLQQQLAANPNRPFQSAPSGGRPGILRRVPAPEPRDDGSPNPTNPSLQHNRVTQRQMLLQQQYSTHAQSQIRAAAYQSPTAKFVPQVIQSRATPSPRQLIPVQTATLPAAQPHGYQQQQQGVATPLTTNGNAQQDGTAVSARKPMVTYRIVVPNANQESG